MTQPREAQYTRTAFKTFKSATSSTARRKPASTADGHSSLPFRLADISRRSVRLTDVALPGSDVKARRTHSFAKPALTGSSELFAGIELGIGLPGPTVFQSINLTASPPLCPTRIPRVCRLPARQEPALQSKHKRAARTRVPS